MASTCQFELRPPTSAGIHISPLNLSSGCTLFPSIFRLGPVMAPVRSLRAIALVALWACLTLHAVAHIPSQQRSTTHSLHHLTHRDDYNSDQFFPSLAKATEAEIEAARKIVKDAIAKASVLNKARLQNPARNRCVVPIVRSTLLSSLPLPFLPNSGPNQVTP